MALPVFDMINLKSTTDVYEKLYYTIVVQKYQLKAILNNK